MNFIHWCCFSVSCRDHFSTESKHCMDNQSLVRFIENVVPISPPYMHIPHSLCDFAAAPNKEWSPFLHSLNPGWPWDMLCPTKCAGRDTMPIQIRSQAVLHASTYSLRTRFSHHWNKFSVTCWRRRDHREQKWAIPTKAILDEPTIRWHGRGPIERKRTVRQT